MKKSSILLFALAVIAASCQKDIQEPADLGTKTYVSAVMGNGLTKTALGEKEGNKQSVVWENNDKININGIESAELAEGGSENAVFEFTGDLGSTYYAAYPASAISSFSAGSANGSLPSVQNYREGQFDASAGLMLGTGDQEGVTFKHAMAYIAFVPQGDGATITSLELTAAGGEKLSGAFTTDYTTLTMSGEASSKVTVNCPTPVALGNEIIVSIPAQTYTQGFVVKFTDSDGGSMEKTAAGSFTAAAGHIYTTTLPYVAESVIPTVVYLAGDPFEWKWTDQGRIDGTDGVFEITCNLNFTYADAPYDGFKMFGANAEGYMDWDVVYGMDPNSTKEDISFDLVSEFEGDPQFYLKNLGYDSGRYTLTFNFNTMKLTVVPEASYPTSIRIYGPVLPWGWDNEDARSIINGENGIFEFSTTLALDEAWMGFKFVDNTSGSPDWNKEYGMVSGATADNIGFDLVSTIGGDPQFYLNPLGYESGTYTVRIDFTTMKLTVTPEAIYPTSIRIYGDPFEWGWENNDSKSIINGTNGVFNITTYLDLSWENATGQGFKFVDNSTGDPDWNKEYAMRPDATADNIGFDLKSVVGDNQIYLKPFGFTSGTYTITIDFSTMKITVTPAESEPEYPETLYLFGDAIADAKWNPGSFVQMTMVSPGVFKAEHVNIDLSESWYGFKLCTENTWSTEYRAKYANDNSEGAWEFELKTDDTDKQFYPRLKGYTSGYHTITADFNTMTVSMTKE